MSVNNNLASVLLIPALCDQLDIKTLLTMRAVNREVSNVSSQCQQWRVEFSERAGIPIADLVEPPEGVNFRTLCYGHRSCYLRIINKPLTQKQKRDVIIYKSYIRPNRYLDINEIMDYSPAIVPRGYCRPLTVTQKFVIIFGATAYITIACILGSFFFVLTASTIAIIIISVLLLHLACYYFLSYFF